MKWNTFDYLKPETFPQVGDVVLWCDENGEMQVGYMDRGPRHPNQLRCFSQ